MSRGAAPATPDLGVPTKIHSRDPAILRPFLTELLAAQFPERQGLALGELAIPTGAGVNNETLLLDLSWREGGVEQTGGAVVRLESEDTLFPQPPFSAHYRIYEVLGRLGQVPVPAVWGLSAPAGPLDRAFFFMDRLSGDVPPDQPPFHATGWVHDLQPGEQRTLWESAVAAMVRLHATPASEVSFLDRPGQGASGLEQEFSHALSYMDWALAGERNRVLEAAAGWLKNNFPDDAPTGFSWGDARPQNLMFCGGKVVGLLDWDMASLAGPEADLAWWTLMDLSSTASRGIVRLPGWGSPAETIALWEKLSGRKLRHMDWHFVFAAFRAGVILMRLAKLLDAKGQLPEQTRSWKDNNTGVQYCASLLGLPPLSEDSAVWPGLGS